MIPGRVRPASLITAALMTALAVSNVAADLQESQVLVVYDSRNPDSLSIAEFYAGSVKVPGGEGQRYGIHPHVRVLNLADLPNAGFPPSTFSNTITYASFISKLRDPLRGWLNGNGLAQSVRCIVLTKGIPHRIEDTDAGTVGDQPGATLNEINAGDFNAASVDSELVLLQQNLTATENGNGADSPSDGCILNPYWKSAAPIDGFSSANIQSAKNFSPVPGNVGVLWRSLPAPPAANIFTPGDMYLVCRLDGNSVADVRASISRAQNLTIDLDSATIILDESASDGVQNVSDGDLELDNDGPVAFTNFGDDYEQTRDFLLADGRFPAANIRYDRWSTVPGFLVGPLIDFGGGTVVNGSILLLGTYGANHSGVPGTPGDSATRYPFSFTYAPGAIFNTVESYNGRSFGGAGLGIVQQGQVADFIQAGGTFGIGNVWEPLSFSIPDNILLVRNFVLGSLTWGEAAYTSMPVLSWMEVVIGDPLAKFRRTREDINGDDRTDIDDLYAWFAPASRPRDLNRDGRIDRADVELIRNAVRSPGENGLMRPPQRPTP